MTRCSGLDLFVSAGPSEEQCTSVIAAVLGLGRARLVQAEDFDALLAAIESATAGWVVCHYSGDADYPYRFDVNLIDGRSPIDLVPEIVRKLGVAIVVPDDGNVDPYAGLRFALGETVQPFSLLPFDD